MIKILAIYFIVSIIFSIIQLIDGYFVWKKKMKEDPAIKEMVLAWRDYAKKFLAESLKSTKVRLLIANPYTILVVLTFLIIACPLFFPFSVASIIHNILFYKEIQQKKKDAAEAKKKHECFMETEGEQTEVIDDRGEIKMPVHEIKPLLEELPPIIIELATAEELTSKRGSVENPHGFDVHNPAGN